MKQKPNKQSNPLGLSKKTISELRKLAKFMEKVSGFQFNMSNWFQSDKWYGEEPQGRICETEMKKEEKGEFCGTACCLAGWQIMRIGYCVDPKQNVYKSARSKKVLGHVSEVAEKTLGLETDEANLLFLPGQWPAQYNTRDPKDAAKRIIHFIEHGI